MIQVYEGMFILDPNRYAREAEAVSGQIATLVAKLGGEMLVSRMWEERRLAYPINGVRKGVYWIAYFKLDSLKLKELHEAARISESIMRTLVLRIDPRIADTLVTHALGHGKPKAAPVVTIAAVETVAVVADTAAGEGMSDEAVAETTTT